MGIHKKTFLSVGFTIGGVIVFLVIVSRWLILGGFERLEREDAVTNATRTLNSIQNVLDGLHATVGDWAPWDDTYRFVSDLNPEYIQGNLNDDTFLNLTVDFMLFSNSEGRIVYKKHIDVSEGKEGHFPAALARKIESLRTLIRHPDQKSTVSGILSTAMGPCFVSSMPILKSDFSGPVGGSLIMGKYLDSDEIHRIGDAISLKIEIEDINAKSLPADFRSAISSLDVSTRVIAKPLNNDQVAAYFLLPDMEERPSRIIRVTMPRKIFQRGKLTWYYYLISLSVTGLVFFAVIFLVLNKMVLAPIRQLSRDVQGIARSGDFTGRLSVPSKDEIGALAGETNHMLEELYDIRKKLEEQSYRVGMAALAADVLHQTGNALSPVKGNIRLLTEQLTALPSDRLNQAVVELSSDQLPSERQADLLRFVGLAVSKLSSALRSACLDLDRIGQGITDVESVMAAYRHKANGDISSWIDKIQVDEIIQDAISSFRERFNEYTGIKIETAAGPSHVFLGIRVTLLTVIRSLLVHASGSIVRQGFEEGLIFIETDLITEEGRGLVRLTIEDNGEGADPESIGTLFNRHSNTDEVTGDTFDLHLCANGICAMNGRLVAESDGIGKGTRFIILLPVADEPGTITAFYSDDKERSDN